MPNSSSRTVQCIHLFITGEIGEEALEFVPATWNVSNGVLVISHADGQSCYPITSVASWEAFTVEEIEH